MVDLLPRKYRQGDPRGPDAMTPAMKAFNYASEKERARLIREAFAEELAEFNKGQIDMFGEQPK